MTALVLDTAAFSALAHPQSDQKRIVRAALRAAMDTGSEVVVPAAVPAEQYRGGQYDQVVDSFLGRETGIGVTDTTRQLARQIGNLLARSGAVRPTMWTRLLSRWCSAMAAASS